MANTTVKGKFNVVAENGDVRTIYLKTTGDQVLVDRSSNASVIPNDVANLQHIVNKMGSLALKSKVETSDFTTGTMISSLEDLKSNTDTGKIADATVVKDIESRVDTLENSNLVTVDELDAGLATKPDTEINDTVTSTSLTWSSKKLSDQLTELNSNTSVLTNRVNNLSTLQEGSTTGDAELIDIRTGTDGTIYDSAGEAVRTQFSELQSENFTMTEEYNLIGVNTDDMTVGMDAPYNGYGLLVKKISDIKKIETTIYASRASTVYCDILDANKNVLASANATYSTANTSQTVVFIFENSVSVTSNYGYVRIYFTDNTWIANKIYTGQTFNSDIMYGYSSGYTGEYYCNGTWSNLTLNQSYYYTLPIAVYSRTISKQSKNAPYRTMVSELQQTVSLLCNGTNVYVKNAQELVNALELAQNAVAGNWYNIYIDSGEYDLLPFIDLERITTVTATGYRGIEVPRYTRLIGDKTNRPHIYVYLDSDGYNCTTEQMWTVSTLNLKNDSELYNLYVDCRNARYAVHDDGGNKAYIRYCENCIFKHRGYTSGMSFAYCSGYGHGTYKGSKETFKSCTFIGSKYGLYVHDNPNYNISSEISIDNCRFETALTNSVHIESMGAPAATSLLLTNNTFNASIKKTTHSETDSITINGYNNSVQASLGVEIE